MFYFLHLDLHEYIETLIMIYICCLQKFYHFFEDYVNSIISKENFHIIIEDKSHMLHRLQEIYVMDKNYIFIVITTPLMNLYKLEYFDKKRIYILNTEQLTNNG